MKKQPYFIQTILFSLFLALFAGCKNDSNNHEAGVLSRGQTQPVDRFEAEIKKFEEADKAQMPPKGAVLFVGSSSIRLWNTLARDFDPMPVINRGFGGSTIPEVMHYADRIIYKYQPGVIVFYCGENDIAESTAPPVAFQDFKKFIGEKEENLPGTPVVFISAKPSPARWQLWNELQQFNSMVLQFAQNRPDLHYVDISGTLLTAGGEPDSTLFVEDQLHLNGRGYGKWAGVLKQVLSQLYAKQMAQ